MLFHSYSQCSDIQLNHPWFIKSALKNDSPVSEIPDGTKKCCSACFTKMTRKIAQLVGGGSGFDLVKSEGPDALWTDDEIELLKTCLRLSGRNWSLMADKLSNKTSDQCKKFFYENRKKLQLDKLVMEYKRVSRQKLLSNITQGQCVQIGRFFYFLVTNFLAKVAQISWYLFGLF